MFLFLRFLFPVPLRVARSLISLWWCKGIKFCQECQLCKDLRASNHLSFSLCSSSAAFSFSLCYISASSSLWFQCDCYRCQPNQKICLHLKCLHCSCVSILSHVTQPVCRLSHSLKQSFFYANVRRFAVVTCLVKIVRGIESASKCVLAWELLQSHLLTWKSNLKIFITLMGTTQIIQMILFSLWRMFWHKMLLKLFFFHAWHDLKPSLTFYWLQFYHRTCKLNPGISVFFIGPKSNCFCGFFLFPWGNTTQTQL